MDKHQSPSKATVSTSPGQHDSVKVSDSAGLDGPSHKIRRLDEQGETKLESMAGETSSHAQQPSPDGPSTDQAVASENSRGAALTKLLKDTMKERQEKRNKPKSDKEWAALRLRDIRNVRRNFEFPPLDSDLDLEGKFDDVTFWVEDLGRNILPEISYELSTSDAAQVFEKVTKDVPEFLMHPKTAPHVLAAGVWDYLIANIFERPSGLCGGELQKTFEDLCEIIINERRLLDAKRGPIKLITGATNVSNLPMEFFHECRARFAIFVEGHLNCERDRSEAENEQRRLYQRSFGPRDESRPQWDPNFRYEPPGEKEEMARAKADFMSKFGPFLHPNKPDRVNLIVDAILSSAGALKQKFSTRRECFEIRMAAGTDMLDTRYDTAYRRDFRGLMIPVGEILGHLSLGPENVKFVVRPIFIRRGYFDAPTGIHYLKLDGTDMMAAPKVLRERLAERADQFWAMPEKDRLRSWREANGKDPNLEFPIQYIEIEDEIIRRMGGGDKAGKTEETTSGDKAGKAEETTSGDEAGKAEETTSGDKGEVGASSQDTAVDSAADDGKRPASK